MILLLILCRQRQPRKSCSVWNVPNANTANKHHWNVASTSNWVVTRSARGKWSSSKRRNRLVGVWFVLEIDAKHNSYLPHVFKTLLWFLLIIKIQSIFKLLKLKKNFHKCCVWFYLSSDVSCLIFCLYRSLCRSGNDLCITCCSVTSTLFSVEWILHLAFSWMFFLTFFIFVMKSSKLKMNWFLSQDFHFKIQLDFPIDVLVLTTRSYDCYENRSKQFWIWLAFF